MLNINPCLFVGAGRWAVSKIVLFKKKGLIILSSSWQRFFVELVIY